MTTAHHPMRKSKMHARKKNGRKVAASLLIAVIALVAAFAFIQNRSGADQAEKITLLQKQFHDAASGIPVPENIFGGTMVLKRSPDGSLNITASGVPAKACTTVGFNLSKEGVVVVNGVLSPRLSAARLTEMCNANEEPNRDNNLLSWSPRPNG